MMKTGSIMLYVRGMVLGACVVIVVFGCAAPEIEKFETASSKPEMMTAVTQISRISTQELVGKMRITIEADSELTYTAFKLTDPLRLVLDLPNVDTTNVSESAFDNRLPIMRITPFQFADGETVNSRVEIALARLVPYQVFSDANKLFIDLEVPVRQMETAPVSAASLPPGFEELTPIQQERPFVMKSKPDTVPPEISEVPVSMPELPSIQIEQPPKTVGGVTPLPGIIPLSSVIKDVQVAEVNGKTRITIFADKTPEFDVKRTQNGRRLTLDLKQSDLPPGGEKVISPDGVGTTVKHVRTFQLRRTPEGTNNVVRVRVDLMKSSKHEVMTESGKIILDIEHPAVFAKTGFAGEEEIVEVPLTTGIETALQEEAELLGQEEIAADPTIRAPKSGEEREYKGQVINVYFQEADILEVLDLIAEVSQLNLVVHPGVSGTVTVRLTNVPWDQALDIVLKMNDLSVEIEGNILRVAAASVFQGEINQRVQQQQRLIEARRVQEELEPLETQLLTVNFISTSEAIRIVDEYFRGADPDQQEARRGTITEDPRTKTLIIQDTADNIEKIEEIVATLDRRTPQVMIEARIVALSTGVRKELGISWAGSFSADAQHGNALDYRFPYSIQIPGFGVNLPGLSGDAFGTTGLITFGSIDDVLTIFAQIDAAEEEYKAKTLGQPKIFTQDNISASVDATQTRQIAGTTTIASDGTVTTTTETASATLSLSVTPRISSDGYVTMTVDVSNGAFTNPTGGDVNQQTVNSEITIKDGETAVIGGVFNTSEAESFSAVPYLHKIPLIGWLFKSTLPNAKTQSELLVFLTPHILDRDILKSEQEGTDVSYSY